MTSDNVINTYIREAIELIVNDSSYQVIQADQNAPRPKKSYCTIKVLASKSSSLEEFSHVDEGDYDSLQTTKAMRSIMVSFNFYKNNVAEHDPFYIAGLCRQGLNRESITAKLNSDGLGLSSRSSIKNNTFELDNGFEERASFTAHFNFVDEDSEVVTTISTVSVEGEYHINGRTETFTI